MILLVTKISQYQLSYMTLYNFLIFSYYAIDDLKILNGRYVRVSLYAAAPS
jgi:hypothetical protein